MAQSNGDGTEAFMESLGYKLITATKDHRTVERYEYIGGQLQNISKQLAHMLFLDRKQHELDARIDEWKAMGDFLTEADKRVLSRNFLKLYKLHGERLEVALKAEREAL